MERLKTLFLPFGVLVLLGSARPARADLCAYVANGGSDYISVIDVATNSLVAEIGVQGFPRATAVDPGGQFIYAVVDGRLSVIDASTYRSLREIPASEECPESFVIAPHGGFASLTDPCGNGVDIDAQTVVVSPDGRMAYLGDINNGVDVVDLRRGVFVKSIFTGGWGSYDTPLRSAISSDGAKLYVPFPYTHVGSLAVVDTATTTVADTIAFLPELEDPQPIAVALSPDGRRAYVLLQSGNGRLPVLDTGSRTVADVFETGGTADSIALSSDGSKLYVARTVATGEELEVIDVQTKGIIRIPLGMVAGPGILAVAPESNVVYVAGSASPVVFAVDAQAHAVVAQIPVGGSPRDIAVGRINGPCRPVAYTPEPTDTPTPTPTATPTKVPLPQCPEGVPCLSVSSVAGRPGNDLTVEVRLHTAGWNIAGTENDILFDPGLSLHDCTAGDGSVTILTRESTSSLRALVFGGSLVDPRSIGPIADGTVLYRCTLTIAQDASVGTYYLRTVSIVGADPAGQSVIIIGADGTVLVSGQRDPQAQTAASPAGKSGCAVGGNDAPQWWFSLALLIPALARLLRGPGLRESRDAESISSPGLREQRLRP